MAASPNEGAGSNVGIHVKLDGAEFKDITQVISARITTGLGRISEAVISLASGSISEGEFPLTEDSKLSAGTEIEIGASYDQGADKTLFKGIITGMRMKITGERGPRMDITARDKAIKLTRARKTALFEQKKDSDVMQAIITEAGLSADVTATSDSARDQIQHDTTDWEFLRLLADRQGYVLKIENDKITAAEPDTGTADVLTLTLGEDILDFDARVDTQALIKTATGRAWDSTSQAAVDGAGQMASKTWGNVSADDMAKSVAERAHTLATSYEAEAADLTTISSARLTRSVLSAIQGRCTFRGSDLAVPGAMLELKNLGQRFGGKAYISGVEHIVEDGEWATTTTLGLPEEFVTDNTAFGGAAAQGLTGPIHGLQVGKVAALSEDPDGKLRIKVNLPMITEEGANVWARYAQPYASNEAGIQFMPEIDDEVLVAFLNADPNAPVVVGSLHNGTAAQPNPPADEDNYLKTIVTREKLKIEFDDEKKVITVETPGGHKLVMDDDATEVKMEDSNGNSMTMSSSGIVIDSAGSIEIKASSSVDVTAGSDATVSGVNVTCSADAAFEGSGGASGKLSGGGQATVEGAVVMIN